MAISAAVAAICSQLRDGDEALDRGLRGPGTELDLLREAGLIRAPLPKTDGGEGLGTSPEGAVPLYDVLFALGQASLPVARIYEGHVNAIRLVVDHGTPDQRRRMAALVNEGAMAGVWGADSESPVMLESGRLTGTKVFASGLGDLSFAVLTARCAQGLQMVIADVTEKSRFDFGSWDVTGMTGSRSGRFDCSGILAPRNALLGRPDALFEEPAFHGGIWRLLACYAGAMTALAREVQSTLRHETTTDDTLAAYRIGQIVMESQTAEALAQRACVVAESTTNASSTVATILFFREAIEQAALRQFVLIERCLGTSLHQTGSRSGRIMRNLRFYLRQAQLDSKLAYATSIWAKTEPAENTEVDPDK